MVSCEIVEPKEIRQIRLVWDGGDEAWFPYIWFRHELFFGSESGGIPTRERWVLPDDPTTLQVLDLKVDDQTLKIVWEDKIVTEHSLEYLRQHKPHLSGSKTQRHKAILWTRKEVSEFPWFEVCDLEDDRVRFSLLRSILDYGVARVKGLDSEPDSFENLCSYFGPIHETGYGRLFEVRTDSSIELGANTAVELGPHNDESYRYHPPGITIFQCIEAHPSGGATTLYDGFLAAEFLREEDPDSFKLLTSTPIDFSSYSSGLHYRSEARVISLDKSGAVCGVRWTDRTIDRPDVPIDLIEPIYKALYSFSKALSRPKAEYRHRLNAGEVHIFDNQRVLHGRTAFDPNTGSRHLRQAAVDRDEFHSSLRLLAERLGESVADLAYTPGAFG